MKLLAPNSEALDMLILDSLTQILENESTSLGDLLRSLLRVLRLVRS